MTHILQALAGLNPCFPSVSLLRAPGYQPVFVDPDPDQFLLSQEIKYKVLNVMDVPWENIGKHFSNAVRFIRDAIRNGGTVFVHW